MFNFIICKKQIGMTKSNHFSIKIYFSISSKSISLLLIKNGSISFQTKYVSLKVKFAFFKRFQTTKFISKSKMKMQKHQSQSKFIQTILSL